MKHTYRHIPTCHSNRHMSWLLLQLLLLCLAACSKPEKDTDTSQPTKLYIYVHAPHTAVPTRAYTVDVDPIGNEAKVYSLQIWVYGHTSQTLLGYYASTQPSSLSSSSPDEPPYELIQMTIDETYAAKPAAEREHVDVYVAANIADSNCNVTLDGRMTQAQLEAALIQKTSAADPFGVTTPVSVVPEDVGLPMSGVLRNQPVTGTAPVLRLDNNSGQIAHVTLIRTVSKLRFAFANQTGNETLTVKSITLNAAMIPEEQYLFMAADAPYNKMTCHIKTESGYNTTTPELLAAPITDVPTIDQPVIYTWGNNEDLVPQAYESMLDNAAAAGHLTQRQYYLRESDKQLQGEIKYQIGEGAEQTAYFQMVDEGGFSRNHIWTVYAYQAQARLHVVVVTLAPWKTTETNYEFYNW